MGFEPTTTSLEGWDSTTELRPLLSFFIHPIFIYPTMCAMCAPPPPLFSQAAAPSSHYELMVGRQGFEPWKT